jgi:hypothetical protein
MVETGKYLSLAAESAGEFRGGMRTANELDRDVCLVRAIGALGEVHSAHSAVAEEPDQAIRANAFADARRRDVGREVFCGVGNRMGDRIAAGLVRAQECFYFRAQSRIIATLVSEQRLPRREVKICGGDEECFNRFPAGLRHTLILPPA